MTNVTGRNPGLNLCKDWSLLLPQDMRIQVKTESMPCYPLSCLTAHYLLNCSRLQRSLINIFCLISGWWIKSKKWKTTNISFLYLSLWHWFFFFSLPGRGQTKSRRSPLPALFSTSSTSKRVLLKVFTAFKIPFVRPLIKLVFYIGSPYTFFDCARMKCAG